MVPLINPPIYSTSLLFISISLLINYFLSLLAGLGPLGLAKEENPFPLLTNIFFPITFTLVGYQPVGINPFDLLNPGLAHIKYSQAIIICIGNI